MTKEKKCTKCDEVKGLDGFHKDNSRRDGLSFSCKTCELDRKKKYRQENKGPIAERGKIYRQENKGPIAAYNNKYRQENREAESARTLKWQKENPSKARANNSKRRARKNNATPPWLTQEQDLEIKLIYKTARELEEMDGVKRHVDHIVPLKGKGVRGFHVPWNLQILTAEQNTSKSNKHSDWN